MANKPKAPKPEIKLRGPAVIRAFFSYLATTHSPVILATTRVKHDPGGVLAEYSRAGGKLRQYYPNELGPPTPKVPLLYRRAEQLVTKILRTVAGAGVKPRIRPRGAGCKISVFVRRSEVTAAADWVAPLPQRRIQRYSILEKLAARRPFSI